MGRHRQRWEQAATDQGTSVAALRAGSGNSGSSLEALEEVWPPTGSYSPASRTLEAVSFCCFKPHSLQ